MRTLFNAFGSAIATAFVYVMGEVDVALQCLLVVIVLDYITGLLKGFKLGILDSKIGIKGFLKKIGILCLVALSVVIDKITGETGLIRTMVIYYLVANEGLSIIENLSAIDIIVPEFIKERLNQIKTSDSKKR